MEVIIEDIRRLARWFVSCLFRFVRRSANVRLIHWQVMACEVLVPGLGKLDLLRGYCAF
ncbi:hypothetical protein RHMOL_Rhmol02G0150000 [Rhododendron molle]|uniref:Uncharacterized protein n=1 Tax=Rhododendron molle TaxID=49168 RepID=A0ACC0PPZ0_RHOML|nr:hypothetical protein RHMOL_Rhmol02G0150000 [Rhododendron molle]